MSDKNQSSTLHLLRNSTIVIVALIIIVKLVLMFLTIPVTVGMRGQLVDRGENHATLEVNGYKIRDCDVIMDSFVGYYRDRDSVGLVEVQRVDFPYDRLPGNSRAPSTSRSYNFGLFRFSGLPSTAEGVYFSSKHSCDVDGVRVIVSSISSEWDVTKQPNHEILRMYQRLSGGFGAFNLPTP